MRKYRASNAGFQLVILIGFVFCMFLAWWLGYFLVGLIAILPTFLISFAMESYYAIDNDVLLRYSPSGGTFKNIKKSGGWRRKPILKLSEVEKILISKNFIGPERISFMQEGSSVFAFTLAESEKFLSSIKSDFPQIEVENKF